MNSSGFCDVVTNTFATKQYAGDFVAIIIACEKRETGTLWLSDEVSKKKITKKSEWLVGGLVYFHVRMPAREF